MNKERQNQSDQEKHYDLTEEASKRPESSDATTIARQVENDDINEETNIGSFNSPDRDFTGENRIATSLNDD